jgi:hypothetical protein
VSKINPDHHCPFCCPHGRRKRHVNQFIRWLLGTLFFRRFQRRKNHYSGFFDYTEEDWDRMIRQAINPDKDELQ